MDWYSRIVLSWRLSTTMDVGFCTAALSEALNVYGDGPEIFNSDQGSQFTSNLFTGILLENGIRIIVFKIKIFNCKTNYIFLASNTETHSALLSSA